MHSIGADATPTLGLRRALLALVACALASCTQLQTVGGQKRVAARPAVAGPHAPQPLKPIPKAPPVAALAGLGEGPPPGDQMVVHFIDVGQGDAELLEFSCAAVLIDSGGEKTADVDGRANLVAYLDAFFQRRADLARTLALVVLSHPHIDHTYGVGTSGTADGLLGMSPSVNIQNVVDDGDAPNNASGADGQNALAGSIAAAHHLGVLANDIRSTAGLTGAVISPVHCSAAPGGGVDPQITALWGRVDPSAGSWTQNQNNDSVVVKVGFGSASFLFMGDLEQEGIAAMLDSYSADTSIFASDVLKVGHHGSKNGTTADLLKAVHPQLAVIGAGDETLSHATFSAYSFAHPNKVAIDLLLDASFGVTMARPAKTVHVGIKGADHKNHIPPQFTEMTIDRAIYATGWDGTVDVTAKADGTLSVRTGQ